MSLKELLAKRKRIKSKKPEFKMQDAHKLKRLKNHWRKPRGIDSKIRLSLKGYNKKVQVGYGSPTEIKGLTNEGKIPLLISCEKDIEKATENHAIILSSKLGAKKKISLAKKITEKKLKIINQKDPGKLEADIQSKIKQNKTKKESKAKKKSEKKEKEEKKKKEKLADKVLTEEEKTKAEKVEKDKVLTKKEI